jgi:hypothetical protein
MYVEATERLWWQCVRRMLPFCGLCQPAKSSFTSNRTNAWLEGDKGKSAWGRKMGGGISTCDIMPFRRRGPGSIFMKFYSCLLGWQVFEFIVFVLLLSISHYFFILVRCMSLGTFAKSILRHAAKNRVSGFTKSNFFSCLIQSMGNTKLQFSPIFLLMKSEHLCRSFWKRLHQTRVFDLYDFYVKGGVQFSKVCK